jgi:aminoglycoside phosphotransferase (APT) family kinase protein
MSEAPRFRLPTGTKDVEPRHRFDEARLEAFLRGALPGFRGPLAVRQFRGGQSNPTYELSAPDARFVLRRKPPGALVASAHAVDREYRVLRALEGTGFPAPRALVYCDEPEVIGTPFYLMEHVDGRLLSDLLLRELAPAERRAVHEELAATLARLHRLDPAALGLADYGKPGNYFARQLHRWTRQYRAAAPEEPIAAMERLVEWLPAQVPDDDSTALVHGDFGLNNLLFHPREPRLVAVLDWELSTLGHPLADLTYLLSHRRSPQGRFREKSDDELRALGIPTEAEFVEAYCRSAGRAGIPQLDFYLAFQFFRSAAILQGIAGRVRSGTAAGEGAQQLALAVRPLAELALAHAERLGA